MKGILEQFTMTWRLILQDKGAMLLLFGAGLVYSLFYPYPYSYEQVESVPTLVVDQDDSYSSRTLTRLLKAAPNLNVIQTDNDPNLIAKRLWQGDIMAMVIIPRNFNNDLIAGRVPTVQLASHGGYLLAGSKALASATQATLTMGAVISLQKIQSMGVPGQAAIDSLQPLSLNSRSLFNTNDGYGHSIVPAVMVVIIQQTLLIGVTLLLGRLSERKQLPVGPSAYFGMLLVFFTIALINTLYFFVIATRMQAYSQIANTSTLLAFSTVFCLCISAFALLLSQAFKTRERGLQMLLITSVPMLFMSGYSWPAESLPDLLYYLRWLLPTTSGIHGFVSINQLGASITEVAQEFLMLALLTLLFIAMGLALFSQQRQSP
ncbi:ABC-2 type transport system permease protein [Limnobacter sp. 130]|jgi:ABC-2 type transport system permease protein|nr:ABC-2 type transport system permease protein [Limnobacter sp. 130]